jgi:hypothetical protein
MGMFARRRFRHAGRQASLPINVFAGDPFALDVHGIEHLHQRLRLRRDGVGRARRAGKNDKNNKGAKCRGSAQWGGHGILRNEFSLSCKGRGLQSRIHEITP